jgi:ketosteroid isomerase-like protein
MTLSQELMRKGLEAFSSGDLDRAVAEMSPEIEWHLAFQLPDLPADKSVYSGREEVRTVFESFRSAWEKLTVEIEEIIHEADDLLLTRVRFRGRGAVSGVEVDRVIYYVAEIEDQMLRVLRPFDELEEAQRAAGLVDG